MLSDKQFHSMVFMDWEKEEFPIKINSLLPLLQLQVSPLLMNARAILCEISKAGRVKTTVLGNLTRKTTFALLKRCIVPEAYREMIENEKGPLNEDMISFVHKPRILLKLANLLRKIHGYFYVTQKGKEMIKEASAGELYALLFKIHFSKFNLAYMDLFPESWEFQASVFFSLFRLLEAPEDWLVRNEVENNVMLPEIRTQINLQNPKHDFSSGILYSRFLLPMQEFGLIEIEYDNSEDAWGEYKRIRKTPLFKMFLDFDLNKMKIEKVAEDLSQYDIPKN
jgi:hypothetical protein